MYLLLIPRGYAASFEWAGHHDDETTRDRWGRRDTEIVAIDALVFRSMISQLRPGRDLRERERERERERVYVCQGTK